MAQNPSAIWLARPRTPNDSLYSTNVQGRELTHTKLMHLQIKHSGCSSSMH